MKTRSLGAAVVLGLLAATAAQAQVGPDGIDWCTVGASGNAPWTGMSDPLSPTFGRGSVNYDFKIGRTEVTTAQWVEFANAAMARPDPLPFAGSVWWGVPLGWGATRDTAYTGPGTRYRVRTDIANAGMIPAGGISWRMEAVLCNWLNSGKSSAQAAFMNGAYDVTTFTPNVALPHFNDQLTHTAGAHYWIPTLDEYMKASFYDPNKNGPGQGGWWQQPNGTDTPLVYGPPPSFGGDGTGQANAGFTLPGGLQNQIPLMAYPTVQSPWGLMDLAGGTAEWIEDKWITSDDQHYRLLDGSARGTEGGYIDSLLSYGQDSPHDRITFWGARIASDVPTPGALITLTVGSCVLYGRRERRSPSCCVDPSPSSSAS